MSPDAQRAEPHLLHEGRLASVPAASYPAARSKWWRFGSGPDPLAVLLPQRGETMHDVAAAHLSAWESFYIIVGSSAGALTGLQFVVMALIREARPNGSRHELSAFGSSSSRPTLLRKSAACGSIINSW